MVWPGRKAILLQLCIGGGKRVEPGRRHECGYADIAFQRDHRHHCSPFRRPPVSNWFAIGAADPHGMKPRGRCPGKSRDTFIHRSCRRQVDPGRQFPARTRLAPRKRALLSVVTNCLVSF